MISLSVLCKVVVYLLLGQLILTLTVYCCHPAVHRYPAPMIDVSQGHLRGTWFTTRGGRVVAAFLGIPYATPPIGDLRFSSPRRPAAWQGEYAATSEGPACIQRSIVAKFPLLPDTYGSEDCLYLNVFSPNIGNDAALPVVLFIHGGYFEVGFGKSFLYGPQYLLDEDVVLVTINYRLGLLGFLSLHDLSLPGNLGLKDQLAALRWVKENIRSFGGDPQKVTLFGESAGAASVHYHMIFTAREGLFRGGICNSGTALAPWALHTPASQEQLVELIVRETGCPRNSSLLIPCLRDIPAEEFPRVLHLAKETLSSSSFHQVTVVGPVVEPVGSDDAIITADPWKTNMRSRLPLLAGANQMEGLYWLIDVEKDKTDSLFHELNKNFTMILPSTLQLDKTYFYPEVFSKTLKKFYFGDESITRKNFKNLVQLYSDVLFNYNLLESIERNEHNNTFMYQMNYQGSNSVVHYLGMKGRYGVAHFDEMFYLFPIGGPLIRNETRSDTSLSIELVKMWTNFIIHLDPTPDGSPLKWLPAGPHPLNFINIGQHETRMDTDFLKKNMDYLKNMWKKLKL